MYYAVENPHWTIEFQLNKSAVTAWGALNSKGFIEPVFFDGTVTGDNYLEMLRDVVMPLLRATANFNELYFQKDGVSLHYVRTLRKYLQ